MDPPHQQPQQPPLRRAGSLLLCHLVLSTLSTDLSHPMWWQVSSLLLPSYRENEILTENLLFWEEGGEALDPPHWIRHNTLLTACQVLLIVIRTYFKGFFLSVTSVPYHRLALLALLCYVTLSA